MATPKTLKAIDASLMLLAIAGLLTGGIGCGGGDNLQEFDDAHIKPADPGAHEHHHHHHHDEDHDAPHGGTLVALGDHQYHAEIAWDEKAKTITVYVLDGEAEKAVPIDAEEIVLAIGVGKDAETHKFTAKPQDDDGDKCSRFVTSDKALFDKFHDNEATSGQIDIPIGEKTFPVVVAHDHHDHDHDHGEKDEHKHDEKGDHKPEKKAESSSSPKKSGK